jgi:hypothetical protein
VITKTIIAALLLLVTGVGCNDSYRYPCQNPDNFHKPDCQKPKCLFTQQCPEYLVAPILEKQINAPQLPIQATPEASTPQR